MFVTLFSSDSFTSLDIIVYELPKDALGALVSYLYLFDPTLSPR